MVKISIRYQTSKVEDKPSFDSEELVYHTLFDEQFQGQSAEDVVNAQYRNSKKRNG